MTQNKDKNDNFLLQAGALAAAGFISRIIGLLYRSPLAAVIGDLGSGYFQAAYSIYTIVLLISSYSIPSAVSKVIAQKLALKEYRNAHRIFRCAVFYVLITGTLAGLFLFFGAGLFVDGNAIPVLRVFAPTIFLYGLLGVLRGYFQAHKSMIQTSISQILEQIANALVSIGAAMLLIRLFAGTTKDGAMGAVLGDAVSKNPVFNGAAYGAVNAALLAVGETRKAMYGAMGSALGTGAGVLTGLLFVWGVYCLNKGTFQRRMQKDRTSKIDSYSEISRMIIQVVTPFILSTAAYNLSTSLNSTIYLKLYRSVKDLDEATVYANYGIFSYKAVTIANIPVAFASAMASAMLPSIAQLMACGKTGEARSKSAMAVKSTMLLSIPCAVGLFFLARPVTALLFPQKETLDLAASLLRALAVTVIFFALSTLSSSILQGIGKINTPIYHAVAALTVQTVVLIVLLLGTESNLYALVIANIVYSGLMCVLNQLAVRKAIGYRQEIRTTFLIPLGASLVMGLAAWGIYTGLHTLVHSNMIALCVAIPVAAGIYFLLLLLLKGITQAELLALPKGYLLVKIAKKCRLLR